jgi:hypothetical protein
MNAVWSFSFPNPHHPVGNDVKRWFHPCRESALRTKKWSVDEMKKWVNPKLLLYLIAQGTAETIEYLKDLKSEAIHASREQQAVIENLTNLNRVNRDRFMELFKVRFGIRIYAH